MSEIDEGAQRRITDFHRMRRLATGLLVAMFLLFVGTLVLPLWGPFPAWVGSTLAAVQAFAEAAMVGAIADWFAVVALFRHPFGLPIPHTAIIPRNKERIGDSLGAFICNNFLAPEIVGAKLDHMDLAGRLARWLAEPATADRIVRRASGFLPALLETLEDDGIRRLVRQMATGGLASSRAAPLVARVLTLLVARGHHQKIFDKGIALVARLLVEHEDEVRNRVVNRSWRWLPNWVDEKLADKVIVGAMETLGEMQAPDHPWRAGFQAMIERLILRLHTDPVLIDRVETLKNEFLRTPMVDHYLESLWDDIRTRLKEALPAGHEVIHQGLARALASWSLRLAEDERLRSVLNRWARRMVERTVVPYRGDIGAFISGVVARWDTATVVDKLEVQFGRDLQYIRINGTVVGGMVGLLIHGAVMLLR